MSTDTQVDVAAVLKAAADVAEQYAGLVTQGDWRVDYYNGPLGVSSGDVVVADCSNDDTRGALDDPYLIAASGPDHWRQVAAALQRILQLHAPVTVGTMCGVSYGPSGPTFMNRTKQQCRGCYGPMTHDLGRYPCATVAAVLPLAQQITAALEAPTA